MNVVGGVGGGSIGGSSSQQQRVLRSLTEFILSAPPPSVASVPLQEQHQQTQPLQLMPQAADPEADIDTSTICSPNNTATNNTNTVAAMSARALFQCRPKSHPFNVIML